MTVGLTTLVLNADMEPISLLPIEHIPVEDAVTRVLNGTCVVVDEYDRAIKTPTLRMNWPSVIMRKDFLRADYKQIMGMTNTNLYYRDHGVCAYCSTPLTISGMTVDHVRPKSHAGHRQWENLVAACAACNSAKGNNMPVGEWRPKHRQYAPTYWQLLVNRKKFPITLPHESWVPYVLWDSDILVV